MQIVNKSYFSKSNALNIPLAVENPSATVSTSTPDNSVYLDNLCIVIEKDLLSNALPLVLYNELKALTTVTIDNVGNERWKKLVEGTEYNGKIWIGLNNDLTFIAQRIYETFITDTTKRLSAVGISKVNSENSTLESPLYKIANANQLFVKGYQNGYLITPDIYENFVDWFGNNNDINVSFYQYLIDNILEFPEFEISKFKIYCQDEVKNSFGI